MSLSRDVYCRLALLSLAALLLHALVLGGASWLWPSNGPPPLPVAALQVRVVEAPLPARTLQREVAVAPAAPPPVVAPPNPARRQIERPALVPAVPRAPPPTPAVTAPAEPESIPLYRTQLPPAVTLRYVVSRGALRGTGEMVWRPQADGDRYALTLDVKVDGLTVLSQASTGHIDAAGIAPLRFTDSRPRRGTSAANFQREAGKISYSGSSSEFALKPGAQDRLSWMLQLAAIVSAEPQLVAPGAKVVMLVTGARGDAGLWVFRCIGPEPVDARGGAIDAIKFVREAREAYDTTVQVWLDPRQNHLPVRATQQSSGGGEGFELRLVEAAAPS